MIASERHWAPRGRGARERPEHGGAEHGGDRGAAEGDEHRVEVGDREPGGREREREDRDAERGEREAAQLRAAGVDRCRYRSAADNVTRSLHDLE